MRAYHLICPRIVIRRGVKTFDTQAYTLERVRMPMVKYWVMFLQIMLIIRCGEQEQFKLISLLCLQLGSESLHLDKIEMCFDVALV